MMLILLPYFVFGGFSLFLIYQIIPKQNKNRAKSSVLFNASITEKGKPPNKIFESLKNNNIKLNFLGSNTSTK